MDSKSNREKIGKKKISVKQMPVDFEQYDLIMVGFPIWYGCAPDVVHSFCDKLDFTGKKVVAFATSGGSRVGKSGEKLEKHTKGAKVVSAMLLNGISDTDLKDWCHKL